MEGLSGAPDLVSGVGELKRVGIRLRIFFFLLTSPYFFAIVYMVSVVRYAAHFSCLSELREHFQSFTKTALSVSALQLKPRRKSPRSFAAESGLQQRVNHPSAVIVGGRFKMCTHCNMNSNSHIVTARSVKSS